MTRRELLQMMGAGFGSVGMAGVLGATETIGDPLAPKPPHFPAKAKRVIYLFLNGGPSQVDTFDPKPMLDKYNGQPMPSGGNLKTERKTGNLLKSPFEFKRYGKSGIEVSEIFPKIGALADDLCVIRSMYTDRPNHEPSLVPAELRRKASRTARDGLVAHVWPRYGEPESPRLCRVVSRFAGARACALEFDISARGASGHIPAARREGSQEAHRAYSQSPSHARTSSARNSICLAGLNRLHLEKEGGDPELEASIQAAEIAFRMQKEAPDAFDITQEPEHVRARYGDGDFARGCLIARRLCERGVRMVQVYYGNFQPWDNHDDIMLHRDLANLSDGPIAALLQDLKASGLLDETIVIIGGEFGRTPAVEVGGLVKVQNGRDHNNHGFTYLVAGGGFKRRHIHGATDDFGFKSVDKRVHIHDLHATVLHQMGLDHKRLTYRYSGRDYRLTDVHGELVSDILA